MTDLFQEPDDATPLEPGEREGLLQTWITHRHDLNEAERENILNGLTWARRSRPTVERMLTEAFIQTLHRKMFEDVWAWAGTYRRTERNIGVPFFQIPVDLAALLADARYWIDNTTYAADEIAVRLHHRLVAIHPFPNGNGRHARLTADLLLERLGEAPFSWGGGQLADTGQLRTAYVTALRAADTHDIAPLLAFARS